MSIGIWELLLILLIVFVIFGAGKLPSVMGDIGKGIKNLKDGIKKDIKENKSDQKAKKPNKKISAKPSENSTSSRKK